MNADRILVCSLGATSYVISSHVTLGVLSSSQMPVSGSNGEAIQYRKVGPAKAIRDGVVTAVWFTQACECRDGKRANGDLHGFPCLLL